jgi:AraC-like DNA-binding protein
MMNESDFDDPGAFQEAIWDQNVEVYPTVSGKFRAHWFGYKFGDMWLQGGTSNLPIVAHIARTSDRVSILINPTTRDRQIWRGTAIDSDHLVISRNHASAFCRFENPADWIAVSIPFDLLDRTLADLHQGGLGNAAIQIRRPLAIDLGRLRRVCAGARGAGKMGLASGVEAPSQVWEKDLLEACATCLAHGKTQTDTAAQQRHHQVMARFEYFVRSNSSELIRLGDICAALGVSVRTFRLCCEESLGMGPIRFMRLRRLHRVRRALRENAGQTVTAIASDHGFWELGRFAGEYLKTFGEHPSETLRNARRAEPTADGRRDGFGPSISDAGIRRTTCGEPRRPDIMSRGKGGLVLDHRRRCGGSPARV